MARMRDLPVGQITRGGSRSAVFAADHVGAGSTLSIKCTVTVILWRIGACQPVSDDPSDYADCNTQRHILRTSNYLPDHNADHVSGELSGIKVTVHLIQKRTARRSCVSTAFRSLRLRPTLARLQDAPGSSLDAGEKAIIAERPADALGGAQAIEQVRLRLAGKQIGEAGKRSLIGASAVSPSSLPRKCADVLDHRQPAPVAPASPAR